MVIKTPRWSTVRKPFIKLKAYPWVVRQLQVTEYVYTGSPYQRRQWHPTPVLLPGESHGWRSLVGYSPWGRKEWDTTERLHFHFSLSCIGEGNGNLLQCSSLENPRDRGACWAAIYGVAQSQTWLTWLSSSSSSSSSSREPLQGAGKKKNFEEIMAKKFSDLMKTINLQIQETQQTPNTRNMKKTTPRHLIIKLLKKWQI